MACICGLHCGSWRCRGQQRCGCLSAGSPGNLGVGGCWCELLANTVLGWWWLDPLVALGIAALAVCEGTEAWHGEESGC